MRYGRPRYATHYGSVAQKQVVTQGVVRQGVRRDAEQPELATRMRGLLHLAERGIGVRRGQGVVQL